VAEVKRALIAGPFAAVVALTSACVDSQSPEELEAACGRLADDVAEAQLSGTPTAEQAEETAEALDERLSELRDPDAHEAVADLHSALHALEEALERDDDEHAADVLTDARGAANDAAEACDLDPSRFGV
jgi:hypothetical protein